MPMLVEILRCAFTVKTPCFIKFQAIKDSRRKGRRLVMSASLTTNYTVGGQTTGRVMVVPDVCVGRRYRESEPHALPPSATGRTPLPGRRSQKGIAPRCGSAERRNVRHSHFTFGSTPLGCSLVRLTEPGTGRINVCVLCRY